MSASQVEEFRRCPRRWYEAYVLGNKQPPSAAMLRGTAIHAEIEHYLTTGTFLPVEKFGELVRAAVALMPAPSGLLVEVEINLDTFEGGPAWVGYADVIDVAGRHVYDTKTTSDFRYAKTPAELAHNIQMVAYAYWLAEREHLLPQEEIRLTHVYARTRGKATAITRSTTVTAGHVRDVWRDEVLPLVREMMVWKERHPEKSDALPPNTESCGLFGGCPYRSLCGLDNFNNVFGGKKTVSKPINTEGGSALLARLKAMREQVDASPVTGSPAAGPGPAAEPTGLLSPDAPTRVNDAPAAPAVTEAPTADAPKKRGRPRKNAGDVAEAPSACAEAPAAGGEESGGDDGKVLSGIHPEGFPVWSGTPAPEVYVDCYPVKGGARPTPLEMWLSPLGAQVAEGNGVKDWRMIQFTAKAELAARIREAIDTVPAVVLVSSSAPGADVFLEAVLPYAAKVVRALRG